MSCVGDVKWMVDPAGLGKKAPMHNLLVDLTFVHSHWRFDCDSSSRLLGSLLPSGSLWKRARCWRNGGLLGREQLRAEPSCRVTPNHKQIHLPLPVEHARPRQLTRAMPKKPFHTSPLSLGKVFFNMQTHCLCDAKAHKSIIWLTSPTGSQARPKQEAEGPTPHDGASFDCYYRSLHALSKTARSSPKYQTRDNKNIKLNKRMFSWQMQRQLLTFGWFWDTRKCYGLFNRLWHCINKPCQVKKASKETLLPCSQLPWAVQAGRSSAHHRPYILLPSFIYFLRDPQAGAARVG